MSDQTDTTEALLEVQSRLSPHGAPLLGDCTLILNDGSDRVVFKGGRAMVPERIAEVLRQRSDVVVLAPWSPDVVSPAEPPAEPAGSGPQNAGETPAEVTAPEDLTAEQLQAIADAQAHLDADAVGDGDLSIVENADGKLGDPIAHDPANAAQVEQVMKPGEATGTPRTEVEPPEPLPLIVPAGFEAMTEDGVPRCLAAKADSKQCSNAAAELGACHLAPHKAKVAEAQAAARAV